MRERERKAKKRKNWRRKSTIIQGHPNASVLIMYTFIYSSKKKKKKKKFITIFICLCNTDDKSYLLSPSISTIKKDSWNSITFINLLAKIAQKKKKKLNVIFFLLILSIFSSSSSFCLSINQIKRIKNVL